MNFTLYDMRTRLGNLAMCLLVASLSVSPVMAKGGGKGAGKSHKHQSYKKEKKSPPGHAGKPGKGAEKWDRDDVGIELWEPAIRVDEVRRLAHHHHFSGQKPLPPGIRKNLMRGKPLPPGIAKKHIPDPYLSSLPIRPGYEWHAYGTDLVLVSASSHLVAHVIVDALR